MAIAMQYHVEVHGHLFAKFVHAIDALRVAHMWSDRYRSSTEVVYTGRDSPGLIGQFVNGRPTDEFLHVMKELQ